LVFGALLPELELHIGRITIDSFWIGSVLVILLTGLYTSLGGMRAVAYNDVVQTIVLILGSASLTAYGLIKLGSWRELRRWCGSDMFNLWKPLIPPGIQGTWAPVLQSDAAGHIVRQAWYFNGDFPWLGMLFCAPSSVCGTGARTNILFSAPWVRPTKQPRGEAAFLLPSSNCLLFTCSSFPD
jgi:SSS family solute:Na+ symporter